MADKARTWNRLAAWMIAATLAAGMPVLARAEEGTPLTAPAESLETEAGIPVEAVSAGAVEAVSTGAAEAVSAGAAEAVSTGATEAVSTGATEAVSTGASTGTDSPDHEVPGVQNLSVDSYEIYATGGSRDPLDTVRRGRQVKMLVHVKGQGIRTGDVGKGNVSVTKLNDSFKVTGSPKVKVTSEKEDDLEFTVTFSKLTYLGKGNDLKFRAAFKKAGIPSEILETAITECEETYPREHGDTGSTTAQPLIKVRRITPQAPVGSGQHFTLGLDLENTSMDADIEDMVVSVSPGTSVFIGDDTNSRIVSRLDAGKTASIKLNMIAGAEISGPTQTIDLELKYNYYSGGNLVPGTSSQKVLIPVLGGSASGQPAIRVERGGIAAAIHSGEAFLIPLKLHNTSADKDIRNLSATFESNEQISLMEDTDTRQLGELRAGQSIDVPVRLKAGAELSSAASQLLGMNLKFDYDSDKGVLQGSYSEKIVIPTHGVSKEPGSPTPNIIVANYTYGEKVTAGQVFQLEMEFMNTSPTSSVDNIVLSLDTGEGVSINSSSNTFYIPTLGPGERRKETVSAQALFQSKLQSPKINIACKYEYVDKRERKQSSSTETIAIPVYQPDRFQVKEPGFTDLFRQGEESTISIPYVNKGRGQVFNVEARLEGEIDALERDLSLGNYESGKSGTIDFVVTPKKEGPFRGQVTVTYEDEAMEAKSILIPVVFDVQAAAPDTDAEFDSNGMDHTDDKTGHGLWIFIALTGVMVIAGVIKVISVKRKQREHPSGSEDWEELDHMDEEHTLLPEELPEYEPDGAMDLHDSQDAVKEDRP